MPGVPGAIKQIPADIAGVVGEAVSSVADQVGQGIETAITGPAPAPKPIDPKVQAEKKADEQKRLEWAWGVIQKNQQKLQTDLANIEQGKQQRKVQTQQEDDVKKEQKKIEMTQKNNMKQAQLAAKPTAENKNKGSG